MITPPTHLEAERLTLARIAGACGLFATLTLNILALALGLESVPVGAEADEIVAFLQSIDTPFGRFCEVANLVALIALMCFATGLALLLRRYEGSLPWRSAFMAGAGILICVPSQLATQDAAVFRSGDIDPDVARYAWDLSSQSFANGWVATGAFGIAFATFAFKTAAIPRWIGVWALLAGFGCIVGRTIWTEPAAFTGFAAFWLWVLVVSTMLLTGRLAVGSKANEDEDA